MNKNDWQPIETAPRIEHNRIMAFVPDGIWAYGNPFLIIEWGTSIWVAEEDGGKGWISIDEPCGVEPTHWLPDFVGPNGETSNWDAMGKEEIDPIEVAKQHAEWRIKHAADQKRWAEAAAKKAGSQ